VCLRFLAGAHVFEAAEIQIWQQILYPCLLLASGLRDYEIKLDRRISAARERILLKNQLTSNPAKSGLTQNWSLR
jgi:hypothetical protein